MFIVICDLNCLFRIVVTTSLPRKYCVIKNLLGEEIIYALAYFHLVAIE